MAPDDTTHFGFQTVPLDEKQARVNEVFQLGRPPLRPDERPDVGGPAPGLEGRARHRREPAAEPRPHQHLDVAGGTGDMAFRVLDAGGPRTHVTVLDINGDMLTSGASGRERALCGPHRLRRG